MAGKKQRELDPDNPEDMEELRQSIKKSIKGLFNPEALPDFEEKGVLGGSEELLYKTDAELFPDEIEEYTPEERRKIFKLYKQDNDNDLKK